MEYPCSGPVIFSHTESNDHNIIIIIKGGGGGGGDRRLPTYNPTGMLNGDAAAAVFRRRATTRQRAAAAPVGRLPRAPVDNVPVMCTTHTHTHARQCVRKRARGNAHGPFYMYVTYTKYTRGFRSRPSLQPRTVVFTISAARRHPAGLSYLFLVSPKTRALLSTPRPVAPCAV